MTRAASEQTGSGGRDVGGGRGERHDRAAAEVVGQLRAARRRHP